MLVQTLSHVQLLHHHGLQPARLLCPWDSPGKNTGVGCHFLFQRIFPTQEIVIFHQKKMPHIQGQRRSPRKTVGIAKSCLESNPIPTRHTWRAQPNLCAPGPRDTTDIEPGLCLSVSCGGNISSGLLQEQGLWVQQTWIWHKSSWGRLPFTLQQSHQNLHGIGETDSWRAQTKPCTHQDPEEKGSDPTRD